MAEGVVGVKDGMKLHEAMMMAVKAHKGQVRKGTDVPYIVHPMEVLQILTAMRLPNLFVIIQRIRDNHGKNANKLRSMKFVKEISVYVILFLLICCLICVVNGLIIKRLGKRYGSDSMRQKKSSLGIILHGLMHLTI